MKYKQRAGARETIEAIEHSIDTSLQSINQLSQYSIDINLGHTLSELLDDALSVRPIANSAANVRFYASEILKDGLTRDEILKDGSAAPPAHLDNVLNALTTLGSLKREIDAVNKLVYRYIQLRIHSDSSVSTAAGSSGLGRAAFGATSIPPPPATRASTAGFTAPSAPGFASPEAGGSEEGLHVPSPPDLFESADIDYSEFLKKF